MLGETEVGAAYRGLIAAAQSDRAVSRAHFDRLIEPANVACRRRLALARERGEIRADINDQDIIDLLWGSLYYRLLLRTRPLEPEQIDAALGHRVPRSSLGTRPAIVGGPTWRMAAAQLWHGMEPGGAPGSVVMLYVDTPKISAAGMGLTSFRTRIPLPVIGSARRCCFASVAGSRSVCWASEDGR
jgi:hypothetical protein